MKILLLTQYFWPESFRINDVALGLKSRGHEVVVLTGLPNYPEGKFHKGYGFFSSRSETWNGIKIYRVPLIPRGRGNGIRLFLNYLSFAITASFRALFIRKDFDSLFVYEPSPVTVGIPAMALKALSGKKYHFWVQDLWPASITAAAGVKNRLVIGILDHLTKSIYQRAATVLVQSKGFIPYIVKQGIPENKIVYLPNSTESFAEAVPVDRLKQFNLPENAFNLLFAGNIGNAQSFDTLVEAAALLKVDDTAVNWIIVGDGRMKKDIEKKITEKGLEGCFFLLGRFPVEEMPSFYASADALLLSLKKDEIFTLTVPSKLQSYMAFGKPVIASIDGEGANIIAEAGCGFVAEAENASALATIIQRAFRTSEAELNEMGCRAKKYFEQEFERNNLLSKLESILAS